MLLAVDTATHVTSLALHDGQNVLVEQTWPTANNQTVALAPALQQVLAEVDATPEQLTALAVCIGPGTYTGLRVGVSLVKGLAAARGLPLIGIETLDILAAGQPQTNGGLVTVAQAGRGRIVAASYQWRNGRWAGRSEARLLDWAGLIASIDAPATVTGEIDADGHKALAEAIRREVPVSLMPSGFRVRRAAFLAQEAWAKLKAEPGDHPAASVMPVYIKTKDSP